MNTWPEFVVDASVAAKWYLPDEDDVDHALRVLADFGGGVVRLYAPEQIVAEMGSTLAIACSPSRRRLTTAAARSALATFLALGIETTPSRELISDAFEFANEVSCAVYDAQYLVLARRRSLPFLNADRRLHDRVGHLPGVVWIANYASIDAHIERADI